MVRCNLLQNKIRYIVLCLICSLLLPLLGGCGESGLSGKRTLWIVTEQSTWDRIGGQLAVLEKAYEDISKMYGMSVDDVKNALGNREDGLKRDLLNQKVVEFLKD